MGVKKIPVWGRGASYGKSHDAWHGAAVYAVESDSVNYDTGTSVQLFSIPNGTILTGIGLNVETAFTGEVGNGSEVIVKDTAENLAIFKQPALREAREYFYPMVKKYAKVAGPGVGSRDIQVDVNGSAAAGAFRVILYMRPTLKDIRPDNA